MIKTLLIICVALFTLSCSTPVQGFSVLPQSTRSLNTNTLQPFSTPSATALFGKKDARAAGNDRKNKTERVKKVKDDVIEIEGVVYGESYQRHVLMCHRRRSRITGARPGDQ